MGRGGQNIYDLGLSNRSTEERLTVERGQRLAMQTSLAESTMQRVQETGLMPKSQIGKRIGKPPVYKKIRL